MGDDKTLLVGELMAEQQSVPAPYALAMVICDAIWQDPWSGKKTIIGTFSTVFASAFPVTHPIMSVYAAFTDARGRVSMRLRLIDANEEREPIFQVETEIEVPDPLTVAEWSAMANNIVFPEPGEYRMQLFGNGELMLERRILAMKTGEHPTTEL